MRETRGQQARLRPVRKLVQLQGEAAVGGAVVGCDQFRILPEDVQPLLVFLSRSGHPPVCPQKLVVQRVPVCSIDSR